MVDPERYALATELFQRACEMPVSERNEFLTSACGADTALRSQVEKLLAHDETATVWFDHPLEPVPDQAPDADSAALNEAHPPSGVGSYKVIQPIGRGGMGVVYRARQSRPDREVALKLIRPELLSRSAVQRFEREAELLGRLQHPGIAQIFEAGHSRVQGADGAEFDQPFLAMELVDGQSISEYVVAKRLEQRAIIRLLVQVCEAVQHAHQRGVLHLDLKPANILLDAGGRPRILDFGVSQAIESRPPHLATGKRDVAGTLAYMPPEQILGRTEDFDTRTDIYALGALAAELLSGRPLRAFAGVPLEDAILELAVAPEVDLAKSIPGISPELAAVIERALARSKESRYASASEFAADLNRYLKNEPVQALPSRLLRSVRLYVRRHTVPAIVGAIAFGVAAIGVSALAVGLLRASNSAKEAQRANEAARVQAEKAKRMASFLQSTILGVDPEERGPHATFFDAIDYAAGRIHRDLAEAPEVEADVRFSLGFVYRRHGMYAKARAQFRAALHVRERLYGTSDPRTLELIEELGFLALLYGGDLGEARLLLRQALDTYDELGEGDTEGAAWVARKLGLVEFAADNLTAAEAHFARSRDPLVRTYGAAYASRPLRGLARCALRRGDIERARSLCEEAVRVCEGADEQEYVAGRALLVLSQIQTSAGDLADARDSVDAAANHLARLLPDDHPEMAELALTRARIALAEGQLPEARAHALRAVEMRRALLAPGHYNIVEAEATLVLTGKAEDRSAKLEPLFRRAESNLGADHWLTIHILKLLIECDEANGDDSAARRRKETLDTLIARRQQRL